MNTGFPLTPQPFVRLLRSRRGGRSSSARDVGGFPSGPLCSPRTCGAPSPDRFENTMRSYLAANPARENAPLNITAANPAGESVPGPVAGITLENPPL